jgi:hypothetical protein
MVKALLKAGYKVIAGQGDFFKCAVPRRFDLLCSNPPYGHAGKLALRFIEKSLELVTAQGDGMIALLLKADFDSGKTRAHVFAGEPRFAGKLVLRRRIIWFPDEEVVAAPSQNHAWFLWRSDHQRLPTIQYGP